MSLFSKLFGRKKTEAPKPGAPTPAPAPSQSAPPTDPAQDPNLIRVFDGYGREMFITRQQWKDNVLGANIQKVWNQPDDLSNMILSALNDGFHSEVVAAAEHLHQIDPNPVRSACIWGIVLLESGQLDRAEMIFRNFLAGHGEDGAILTNLAKVYAKREDDAQAEELLWHALEVDPNQDNAVLWYQAIQRERGGEAAAQAAMERLAALPGSWRAQLWLARARLQSRQLEPALYYYRESLSRVPRPIPADLLMQISGDLGNAAHLPEALALTEPHFDPAIHGLQVGNNLIKAHLDLGQLDAARHILDQLYALQRPDWREGLSCWDTEIARARIDYSPSSDPAALQMAMLSIQGPVWLRPDSPAAELFPAKPSDAPLVSFLGSSAEVATNSQRVQVQMPDAAGRLSRALPLFLAEQFEFGTDAKVQTLVPWIASGSQGFVLTGAAWEDAAAAHYARQKEAASDYVVIAHLKTQAEPWIAELRLVRTIDARCLAELHAEFPSGQPETALPDLARRMVAAFETECGGPSTSPRSPSPLYRIPPGAHFPYYLVRLEQLLAARCGAMDGVGREFFSGEREVISANIQLCLDCPDNVPARVLLAQTVTTIKRVRPDIPPEFKARLTLLQKEHPLPSPAHDIVQRLLDDALTG